MAAAEATRAAAEANRLSTEALTVDQRPWVFVEGCEPNTDLYWDSSQFFIKLDVRMKNVGKSPALNVEVWIKLTTENDLRELEREQISFADGIRADPKIPQYRCVPRSDRKI